MRIAAAAAALAILLTGAVPERAQAVPVDLVAGAGGTFGVDGISGSGGASLEVSLLWRFEGPLSFGPMAFASDLGTEVGRLYDANDGSDLGATELGHQNTWGVAWRMDARGPAFAGGRITPFGSAALGGYRFKADRLGIDRAAVSAAGVSAGGGLRYGFAGHGTSVGVSVRYHRVFDERFSDYTSVAMDWLWPLGVTAPETTGR